MKRIAAPLVGGLATSFAMELMVYPVVYAMWRGRRRETAGACTGGDRAAPALAAQIGSD